MRPLLKAWALLLSGSLVFPDLSYAFQASASARRVPAFQAAGSGVFAEQALIAGLADFLRSFAVQARVTTLRVCRDESGTHTIKDPLKGLLPLQPGEVAVTKNEDYGLQPYFIGQPSQLAAALSSRVDAEGKGHGHARLLGGVVFTLRRVYGRAKWTFQKNDTDLVAALMGWERRSTAALEKAGPSDVLGEPESLFTHFEGKRRRLATEFDAWVAGGKPGNRTSFPLDGVLLVRKLSGRHREVWTFHERFKKKVAQRLTWKIRDQRIEELKSDETAVSESGLEAVLVGSGLIFARELSAELDASARKGAIETDRHGIGFIRRKTGPNEVWAFKKRNLKRLAKARQWRLSSEYGFPRLHAEEVSLPQLLRWFRGNQSEFVARITGIIEAEGKPKPTDVQAFVRGISFSRRRASGNLTWVIHRRDLPALMKAFHLRARSEKAMLAYAAQAVKPLAALPTADTTTPAPPRHELEAIDVAVWLDSTGDLEPGLWMDAKPITRAQVKGQTVATIDFAAAGITKNTRVTLAPDVAAALAAANVSTLVPATFTDPVYGVVLGLFVPSDFDAWKNGDTRRFPVTVVGIVPGGIRTPMPLDVFITDTSLWWEGAPVAARPADSPWSQMVVEGQEWGPDRLPYIRFGDTRLGLVLRLFLPVKALIRERIRPKGPWLVKRARDPNHGEYLGVFPIDAQSRSGGDLTDHGVVYYLHRGGKEARVESLAQLDIVSALQGRADLAPVDRGAFVKVRVPAKGTKHGTLVLEGLDDKGLPVEERLVIPEADVTLLQIADKDVRLVLRDEDERRIDVFAADRPGHRLGSFDTETRIFTRAPGHTSGWELNPQEETAMTVEALEGLMQQPKRLLRKVLPRLAEIDPNYETAVLEGIRFLRRTDADGNLVWAFNRHDLQKVGLAFAVVVRLDPDTDVAASRWALEGIFVDPREAAETIAAQLDKKAKGSVTIVWGKTRYTKRLMEDGTLVWTFPVHDIAAVAERFGLTRDEDPADLIEKLDLASVIAALGPDPLRLRQYLEICYPELFPGHVEAIVKTAAFRGLRNEMSPKTPVSDDWPQTLELPHVLPFEALQIDDEADFRTEARAFEVVGRAPPGATAVQLVGAYTMRIRIKPDGTFRVNIPIPRASQINAFSFYAVNEKNQQRGPAETIRLRQTDVRMDPEVLFREALALKQDILREIRKSPTRRHMLLRTVEQSLLKPFTYGEDRGFAHLANLIEKEQSEAMRQVYKDVDAEFRKIIKYPFEVKAGEKLYFFQKYTAYRAMQMLKEVDPYTKSPARAVIIANQAGLGKTVTGLIIINGGEALIITPNAVVSTWVEEHAKFMKTPRIEVLEGSYAERDVTIRTTKRKQAVVNVEFMQSLETNPARTQSLIRFAKQLLIDEAQFLGRAHSDQTRGTWKLAEAAEKVILLTATPVKRLAHLRNLLRFMFPKDRRFRSPSVFNKAFPAKDRNAMKALHLLLNRHTVRVRKQDVFETFDPLVPLEAQPDRLPAQHYVSPQKWGRFTMLRDQAESIFDVVTGYVHWCETRRDLIDQGKILPTARDRRFHRFAEGYFSKLHSIRQIMNSPAYIGRKDLKSPKHLAMDKILKHEFNDFGDSGGKVVIFCEYVEQAKQYLKRYAKYNPVGYHGEMPSDSNGYKLGENGKREHYAVDEFGKYVLRDGRPVLSDQGPRLPIRTLDYSRIVFQNDPNCRLLVATYDAGSVGVTFTAAHAVIHDDLAASYADQYQADERAHRIDNLRRKYAVRYYRMQAQYPPDFLADLGRLLDEAKLTGKEREEVRDFFMSGTFDEVQLENLAMQETLFKLLMDWAGDESDLEDMTDRFLRAHLGVLWKESSPHEIREEMGAKAMVPSDLDNPASEDDDEVPPWKLGPAGLSSAWRPVIEWLQSQGLKGSSIAAALGALEEILFSGVIGGGGAMLLQHGAAMAGVSDWILLSHDMLPGAALALAAAAAHAVFMALHRGDLYRLSAEGDLILADVEVRARDRAILGAFSARMRLVFAVMFALVSPTAALVSVMISHAFYNGGVAPRLGRALALIGGRPTSSSTPHRASAAAA